MDDTRIELLETRVNLLQKLVENQDVIINNMMNQIELMNTAGHLTNKRIDNVVNMIKTVKDKLVEEEN